MIYLDASAVVSALTSEIRTRAVQGWIGNQSPDELAISEWVSTEVAAALARKVRSGHLPAHEQPSAWSAYRRMISQGLETLPIRMAHFSLATEMTAEPELNLRAGDALHLAIARDHGASVLTLDEAMFEAGRLLGLDMIELSDQ